MCPISLRREPACPSRHLVQPPLPSPTTHHVAALTVSPPLYSVEMLAPELGPTGRTHKTTNMEDAVQGHNPSSIANHIFATATAAT